MCSLRAGSAREPGWTRKAEVVAVLVLVVGLVTGMGCAHHGQLEEWELADGMSGWEHLWGGVTSAEEAQKGVKGR